MSPTLRRLVTPETDLQALTDQAFKDGLKPLRISGAAKIAAGLTTVDEVLKVAPPASGDQRRAAR
jgi:general secretion pathway protein E